MGERDERQGATTSQRLEAADEDSRPLGRTLLDAGRSAYARIAGGVAAAGRSVSDSLDFWVQVARFDAFGGQLAMHYLHGQGAPFARDNDAEWSAYLMRNHELTERVRGELVPLVQRLHRQGATGTVELPRQRYDVALLNADNYSTGYGLLNGANARAGGAFFEGRAEITRGSDGTSRVRLHLRHAFNDRFDTNGSRIDAIAETLAGVVGDPHHFDVHLGWDTVNEIELGTSPTGLPIFRRFSGWPGLTPVRSDD